MSPDPEKYLNLFFILSQKAPMSNLLNFGDAFLNSVEFCNKIIFTIVHSRTFFHTLRLVAFNKLTLLRPKVFVEHLFGWSIY